MLRLTTLALLAASLACAQDSSYANNPRDYYPNNTSIVQYCVYETFGNLVIPQNGISVRLNILAWPQSGWHSHDVQSVHRPQASVLSTNPAITLFNGCANFTVQYPAYAGWYVVYGTTGIPALDDASTAGFNQRVRSWGVDAAGNKVFFQPYPNNPQNNVMQEDHDDIHHTDANGYEGYTFYLLPSVINQVQQASIAYKSVSSQDANVVDYLNITRGSLPDGGALDSEGFGYTPDGAEFTPWVPWLVRTAEEHSNGTEIDVVNRGLDLAPLYTDIYATLANYNCYLGQFDTYGGPLPNNLTNRQYWSVIDVLHFACKTSPISKQ